MRRDLVWRRGRLARRGARTPPRAARRSSSGRRRRSRHRSPPRGTADRVRRVRATAPVSTFEVGHCSKQMPSSAAQRITASESAAWIPWPMRRTPSRSTASRTCCRRFRPRPACAVRPRPGGRGDARRAAPSARATGRGARRRRRRIRRRRGPAWSAAARGDGLVRRGVVVPERAGDEAGRHARAARSPRAARRAAAAMTVVDAHAAPAWVAGPKRSSR